MGDYLDFNGGQPATAPIGTIDEYAAYLRCYLNDEQIALVVRAYNFADLAHADQKRRSGEPYISHPLAVSVMLAEMRMDTASLCAALLHDVIEDTHFCKADIESAFSQEIADLVDSLTKLTHINFDSKAHAQAENFQKMAMAMAKDIRVILIKMSDRLHNMRTLGSLRPEQKRRIGRETLEIYAPIAQRLGMNNFRLEFEELSFQNLYPLRRQYIKNAVEKKRGNRKDVVEKIRASIEHRLEQEHISAKVVGREKHLYSIYTKMQQKARSFHELTDVFGCRITVDSVDTCYRVLGIVHSLYKPKPNTFKDYIAIPKQNGYQSLHTVLFGAHGIPVEVQIRTLEMDELANNGIAAHWLYKAGTDATPDDPSHARAREWLQSLLDLQARVGSSLEFVEHVKDDLFPDEVFVFTPKGDIHELPAGATPIDFAYHIHTDVGNHCMGCKIDHNLAPLSEPLKSGQTIEIITDSGAYPAPHWLNFVVTGRARSSIRHYLRHQHHGESVEQGRRALAKAMRSLGVAIDAISTASIDELVRNNNAESFEAILHAIGSGERTAILTAHSLLAVEGHSLEIDHNLLRETLTIHGNEGTVVHYGKCCHPIPGDNIKGKINANRGVVVHQSRCSTVNDDNVQLLDLHWATQPHGEFSVHVRATVENKRGILAEVARGINSMHADIEHIETREIDGKLTTLDMTIGVQDRVHLARILRKIRIISGVLKVLRVNQ